MTGEGALPAPGAGGSGGGPVLRSPLHARVLERALPHLQTRHNEVHTRTSLGFALRLLEREPGDPDVVIPGILLHDIGWSRVPEELQLTAFGPRVQNPELQKVHEREGARMAEGILAELGFPEAAAREIAHIVAGHDTRPGTGSPSESIVKDADKLFRFSREGFRIDCERFGLEPAAHLAWLEARIEGWFLTATGRALARQEAAARRAELAGEGAARVRVRVRAVGLPDLVRRWGGDEIAANLEGGTVGELLRWLDRAHARPAGVRLLDASGRLVPEVVMLLDDGEHLDRDETGRRLREGDRVTLVVVVTGG